MGKVAFIVDRTFDDAQFETALQRVRAAGHEVVLVGPKAGQELRGRGGDVRVTVELNVDDADANAFDAAVVPGGIPINHLRTHERILNFLRDVYAEGKPVGVMRDAGFALTRAEVDFSRLLTWPAVKRALLIEPVASVEEDRLLRDELLLSEDADVNAFGDALTDQLRRGHIGAAPEESHEHVDILDEQVIDDATGPAPSPNQV